MEDTLRARQFARYIQVSTPCLRYLTRRQGWATLGSSLVPPLSQSRPSGTHLLCSLLQQRKSPFALPRFPLCGSSLLRQSDLDELDAPSCTVRERANSRSVVISEIIAFAMPSTLLGPLGTLARTTTVHASHFLPGDGRPTSRCTDTGSSLNLSSFQ